MRKCRGGRGIISAVEILVVDDELAIRKGLAAMLEGAGYSVRTARDGIAALGAIRARRSDLVLLDVMMPLMDGFAVCERIRQFDRDLPIVFLTARAACRAMAICGRMSVVCAGSWPAA